MLRGCGQIRSREQRTNERFLLARKFAGGLQNLAEPCMPRRLDARDTTDALARALLARAAYFAPGEPILRDVLLATLSQDTDNPDATLAREDALQRLYGLGLLEPAR